MEGSDLTSTNGMAEGREKEGNFAPNGHTGCLGFYLYKRRKESQVEGNLRTK